MARLEQSAGSLAVIAVAAAAVLAGCMSTSPALTKVGSPPYVSGSGVAATATRALPSFHAIVAQRAIRVTVRPGSTNEAVVTADDNLLTFVVSEVRDGVLEVRIDGNVETRTLPTVAVSASGPIDALQVDSSASLDVSGLGGGTIAVRASGAASVHAVGDAERLDLRVDASSSADLRDLTVGEAEVAVTSASSAAVRVRDAITGTCLASSDLLVLGDPATDEVTADASSSVRRE